MEIAIEIKNLTVVLGGSFEALRNVSVNLPAGKVIGFIGPSGAGKTTLIRSIVGRQIITKGSVAILGQPAGSAALRQQMSYMTQETSVYADLTARQNLHYFAVMSGMKRQGANQAAADILREVDMTGQADQLVRNLSGGQKQRVSLGIALIGHPKLMILDEPTVGLDPVLRDQIWELFRQLAGKGTTIVITSHVMEEAERCDDLLLVRRGRVLAHDSPEEFRKKTKSQTVEEGFLKLVEKKI
jgi:ABC-2 type transport system ATP-binding protein